jgi:tripartite tricarboxylate transporter TctB family protein
MVTRRWLEVATGALTGAFAIAVIVSSVAVGSGWSAGGVESGTFPLIAGVLILAGSLVNIGRGFADADAVLVVPAALRRLAGLFLPAAAFIAAIPFAGIYVASAAYLMWALRIQHRLAVWRSALVAAATVLTLYWLFERTFDVALPHGWIAGALGL